MNDRVCNQTSHYKSSHTCRYCAQCCIESRDHDVEEAEDGKLEVDKHEAFPEHLVFVDSDSRLELGYVPPELLDHLDDGKEDERVDPTLPDISHIVNKSRVFVPHSPKSEVISSFIRMVKVLKLRMVIRSCKEIVLDSMIIAHS